MPEGNTLKREGPRVEVSHEVVKHDKPYRVLQPEPVIEVSKESRDKARAKMFNDAKVALADTKPPTAVEYLRTLPLALLEVHLLAEEATQNRSLVLQYFPKPGHRAREWYFPESLAPVPAKRAPKAPRAARPPAPKNNDHPRKGTST